MISKCLLLASAVSAIKIERDPLLTWSEKPYDPGYPQDYAVPNFGVDQDIGTTHKNLAAAEKMVGHKWVVPKDKPEPLDLSKLAQPDFGNDEDIQASQDHQKAQEEIHKKSEWDPTGFLRGSGAYFDQYIK